MIATRSRRGFSLIEALVALIIAAISLAAVLELQRQLADGQARYGRALELAQLQRDAIVLTEDVNPTEQPDGVARLTGGRSLRWRAEPRGPEAPNTGSAASGRRFALRLYRMTVTILAADGAPLGQVAFDRVGWRRLGEPLPFVPPQPPAPPPATSPPPASGRPTDVL